MDTIYWDHYYNQIILLNLIIVIALFSSLRLFSGVLSHVSATRELITKNNPAYGVTLASLTLSISIMLSGTIYGSPENDATYSIVSVAIFGLIGIGLMTLTRVIFDKLVLPKISLKDEILSGNIAVAISDAANLLAAAIIVRAVMIWVNVFSMDAIIAIFGGYLTSQFLLTLTTLVKRKIFEITHSGHHLQENLSSGNIAIALWFAGKKIGIAFAIAAAASIVVYEQYDVPVILYSWFLASLAFIFAWAILSFVSEKIILWRIDTKTELVKERNIAIGALQAAICISMGLLISSI